MEFAFMKAWIFEEKDVKDEVTKIEKLKTQ